jgi:hypothetical protein
MHRRFLLLLVLLTLAFAAALACQSASSSSSSHHAEPTPSDDDDDDDSSPAADDDASPGVMRVFDAVFEFRNNCHIVWYESGDTLANATVQCGKGYGDDLIAAGVTMSASGSVLRFPEAFHEIHTLTFQSPPIAGGPCGAQPIQLAMSLSGQQGVAERFGGIAAYCGATITGTPARILRLVTHWGHPE